jgi:hypothetical protein
MTEFNADGRCEGVPGVPITRDSAEAIREQAGRISELSRDKSVITMLKLLNAASAKSHSEEGIAIVSDRELTKLI